jgi:starch-binding outer membrane protein, SusD/RagB family
MKNMKTKKLLIFGFIALIASSCVDYLEPYPQGNYDSEQIWEYQEHVQGLIGYTYDLVNSNTRNYTDNEGIYLEGATDNAVLTSTTHVMTRYSQNSMTTNQDPFTTYWNRDYKGMYNVNLFLKDRRGYNTRFVLNPTWNNLVRRRLQGEAFALRAWFQWDLLQKFGGKGLNGEMLGYPIVLEPLDPTQEINLARNTYDECVSQILADCDSAYKYLPIAHRDFLVPNASDRVYAGGKYWGRFDGISTRAIKAMVYLTWASPRFNPGNDISRWDSAAANAIKVINFKMTVDNISSGNSFRPQNPVVWTNPNSPEIIIATRYNSGNDAIERALYPGGFQGNGVIGATQELVDAFPMANGYPIDHDSSGYDLANPYANRDPRFYSVIFYNNRPVYRNNNPTPANLMYTFENWDTGPNGAGKDAAGVTPSNSRTNYHIKKFIFAGLNWADGTKTNRQPHSKFLIRWTHMLLTFAEAANKVAGPTDAAKYGMSAQTAIQYLRARKTYDNANGISPAVPGTPDAYLAEAAAAGTAAFDALVRNERRIETCFEGLRFYDLRRWTTDADWSTVINAPVHGASITQVDESTFTYESRIVANRTFPSPYNPIPYAEMLRMDKLIQNDGWDTWK